MGYDLLNVFSLSLFLTAAFSFGLALYANSLRTSNEVRGLVGILVGAGLWSLADALRMAAPTRAEVLLWNQVTYVGVGVIPPATVLFVAAYTDRERWLRPRRFAAFVAISVLMVAIVFTNQWHGLWRAAETVTPATDPPVLSEEPGLAHLVWNAYVLLGIVPLMYVFLFRELRAKTESRLLGRQIHLLILALTAPVVAAALYVTGVTPVDLTPFGFAVFGIGLTVAMTRYRLLDIVPIARDAVVESIDASVLVLDREDRIVDANPQALDMIGRDVVDIVGENATRLFDEFESVVGAIRTIEDGSTTVSVGAGEETRHYHADFSSIGDERGQFLGRVVIFSDITDRVDRQQRLLDQKQALERKNERLDQFASAVSHDLRNPLNVAQLRLEQARETDSTAPLEPAADALDRMERMTDQLLTLARVGVDSVGTEPVQLFPVTERAWENVATRDATLDIEGELGVVDGEPALLLEVFENLFRNAVEHNDPPVTVTVGTVEGPERAGFFVEDDGTGIDPDDRETVFEYGHTTAQQGTGFGLSIVADIADAHDWRVEITRGDRGGARFEILTGTVDVRSY